MNKLYKCLEDIWKDAEADRELYHITEEELEIVISMINRAYERGQNVEARKHQ